MHKAQCQCLCSWAVWPL